MTDNKEVWLHKEIILTIVRVILGRISRCGKSKNIATLTNHCNCSCVCFKHRVPIAIGSCTMILSGVTGVTRSVYTEECKTWWLRQHSWIVILCPLKRRFRDSGCIAEESHTWAFNNLWRLWRYSNLSWNYTWKQFSKKQSQISCYTK